MNSPVKSKDYYLAQATSNCSTPVKTGVEKQKVVVLGVGLLVVSVAALFKRRIYAPDAKRQLTKRARRQRQLTGWLVRWQKEEDSE